jgi:glutathione S-transferase
MSEINGSWKMSRYTVYGNLAHRDTVVLSTTLSAKGLDFRFVELTASLSYPLAARAGRDSGPYLRTPEGFVLADLHAMLDWIERMHPEPALLPTMPIRRTAARLIEDWLELWLPLWPRRSWATLERLAVHLHSAGFLLGPEPSRPDWILAAWLESDVLIHDHARKHLTRTAPRLVSLGSELLEATRLAKRSLSSARVGRFADDVLPISLLPVLEEIASDYHGYLVENHQACKDGADRVLLDLGLGRRAMSTRPICEERRAEIGRELGLWTPAQRRDIRQILEPVGLWHATTLPPVTVEIDPADPRSL